MRHIEGTAPSNKSYLYSKTDSQAVLDAYNSGNYNLISARVSQNEVTIEVYGIEGRYVNKGNPNGLHNLDLSINIFTIQSTKRPKPFSANPNKKR